MVAASGDTFGRNGRRSRCILTHLELTPAGRGLAGRLTGRLAVGATLVRVSMEAHYQRDPERVEVKAAFHGPAPAGRSYELWAIRGERAPEPAGLFPGGEGPVTARAEVVPQPGEVTAFAVSIEPTGGSPSPTGPVVLAGAVAG